jgi:hypothetical protein
MTAPPIFYLLRRCQILFRPSMPLPGFDASPPVEQPRRRVARRPIPEVRRDCRDVRHREKPRPRWPALYRARRWPMRRHSVSCPTSVPGYARFREHGGAKASVRYPTQERRPRNASESNSGLAKLKKAAAERCPIYLQFVKEARSQAGGSALLQPARGRLSRRRARARAGNGYGRGGSIRRRRSPASCGRLP